MTVLQKLAAGLSASLESPKTGCITFGRAVCDDEAEFF